MIIGSYRKQPITGRPVLPAFQRRSERVKAEKATSIPPSVARTTIPLKLVHPAMIATRNSAGGQSTQTRPRRLSGPRRTHPFPERYPNTSTRMNTRHRLRSDSATPRLRSGGDQLKSRLFAGSRGILGFLWSNPSAVLDWVKVENPAGFGRIAHVPRLDIDVQTSEM